MSPGWAQPLRTGDRLYRDKSVGERKLDLGSVAHRADLSNPCDGRGMHGPRNAEYPDSAGEPKPWLTACARDLSWLDWCAGADAGCAARGVEATVWAAAYFWLGALDSPDDAILYSVDSMTTRGASGLVLQQHWRMMGALEAAGGLLVFGISTAFMFAVLQAYWAMLFKPLVTGPSPATADRG
jgi:hypothetical protein